jgi:hypothetical protein
VIPTIPFDIVAGFAAGAGLALCAAEPLKRTQDALRTRYFVAVLLFAGLVWVPSGLALFLAYPDWSLMYLANPVHLPMALALPVMIGAYLIAPPAGFLVTHQLMREKKAWWLRGTLGGVAVLALLIVLAGAERLLTVAYYDAFHYGGARVSLFRSPLILPLVLISVAVVGAFVATARYVLRHVETSVLPPEELGPKSGNLPSSTGSATHGL